MKCLMCNANVKPKEVQGVKICPKCNCYIGTTLRFNHKKINLSQVPQQYVKDPWTLATDRPKDKSGKYQPHLVLGSLTRAIARVREYGVRKYKGEDGWKQQTAKDYMDAIGRHYDECRNDPESRDLESGLLHIAQIATNAMFVIQMLKEQGIDLDSMNNPPEVK